MLVALSRGRRRAAAVHKRRRRFQGTRPGRGPDDSSASASYPSALASSSLTILGFALPPLAFMT